MRVSVTASGNGSNIAGELRAVAQRVEQLPRTAGGRLSPVATEIVAATIRRVRGTASVGKLGSLDVTARASGGTVDLDGTGPWGLVDKGARSHSIKPRDTGSLRFNGRHAEHVSHPGTRGLRIWPQAEQALIADIPGEVDRMASEALHG